MTETKSKKTSDTSTPSLPEGLLSAIKVARPIVILAGIFYLLAAFTVLLSPEQIAQEAIGPDYTSSDLDMIRLTGWVLLIAGSVFIYSIKLLRTSASLNQLRLGSILVLASTFVTVGGSRNVFSLLVLLIVVVPVFIIGVQAHRLIQQKSDVPK